MFNLLMNVEKFKNLKEMYVADLVSSVYGENVQPKRVKGQNP